MGFISSAQNAHKSREVRGLEVTGNLNVHLETHRFSAVCDYDYKPESEMNQGLNSSAFLTFDIFLGHSLFFYKWVHLFLLLL